MFQNRTSAHCRRKVIRTQHFLCFPIARTLECLEAKTARSRQKFVTTFQNFLTKKVSSNFELGRQPSRASSGMHHDFDEKLPENQNLCPHNVLEPSAAAFAAGNNSGAPGAQNFQSKKRDEPASGLFGNFPTQPAVRESNIFEDVLCISEKLVSYNDDRIGGLVSRISTVCHVSILSSLFYFLPRGETGHRRRRRKKFSVLVRSIQERPREGGREGAAAVLSTRRRPSEPVEFRFRRSLACRCGPSGRTPPHGLASDYPRPPRPSASTAGRPGRLLRALLNRKPLWMCRSRLEAPTISLYEGGGVQEVEIRKLGPIFFPVQCACKISLGLWGERVSAVSLRYPLAWHLR